MDPLTKLLFTLDLGERTLAMAQRVVHQVAQVLAPECTPLFLTDGFKEGIRHGPNCTMPRWSNRTGAGAWSV